MTDDQPSKPYRKGVNAIITCKGKFLIIQKHIYQLNEWNFPGGGREDGETLQENLFRELKEELGADRNDFEMVGVSDHKVEYDYPAEMATKVNGGKYRGQSYSQVVLRFIGNKKKLVFDSKEFRAHMWVKASDLSKYLVFPGQYQNYKAVIDHLVPKSNLIK